MIGATRNPEPLISIVTVCLNAAAHIERCINSVLNQTYPNIEYIIIDGCSTDGTLDIIHKYEERITRWISEKDRGIYDAMNKGIAQCKGEFIGLLNSDDYYASDAVDIIVDAINRYKDAAVFHANTISTLKDGNLISKYKHGNLLYEMLIKHPTCFIRSDIYSLYTYDVTYRIAADYDLLLKLTMDGINIRYIDEIVTYCSPYGISSIPAWSTVIERYKIRSKYRITLALLLFLRDSIMYCDGLYYARSIRHSSDLSKQSHHSDCLCYIKKSIRPLALFIKRKLLSIK